MDSFLQDLSIILVGAGLLACLAVFLRQPIIIAYIVVGIIAGPWGLAYIEDVHFIEGLSHLGITLLLFLAGLTLHPQKLLEVFKKTTWVTFVGCFISAMVAGCIALLFQFSLIESTCIGFAMMFSSTILVVKLLPTTDLHHERIGAACIGVLILQDLLAVAVLAFIRCLHSADHVILNFTMLSLRLAAFIGLLFIVERFVLRGIMKYVERLHEVVFILGLGWCFGIAYISYKMGLFFETGAFFAGVVLASHRIAVFISENLKPLRDFFLVLFFFTLGAKLDFAVFQGIILATCILSAVFIFLKPYLLQWAFRTTGETPQFAKEAGVRLGQLSEFSLLIAMLALELNVIGNKAAQLIQLTTIITFIFSSYFVVLKYPTPIATKDNLIKA